MHLISWGLYKSCIRQHAYKGNMNMSFCCNFKSHVIRRTKATRSPAYERNIHLDESIRDYKYLLLAMPITCFILGSWQIKRHYWKTNLIEDLKARTSSEPIELPENLNELNLFEYYPVKVKGRFLHEKELLLGPRSLIVNENMKKTVKRFSSQIKAGYNIITPFKLEDKDLTILVNRGWVPVMFKDPAKRMKNENENPIEIVGIVRKNEKSPFSTAGVSKNIWHYRDVDGMSEMAGTSPVYLDLVTSKHVIGDPFSCQTNISIRNEHMTYVIIWYTAAVVICCLWFKKFKPELFKSVSKIYNTKQ